MSGVVTVFLGGDVMLGRGVDQVLAHPGDPTLREPSLHDARAYVELAEAVHGPIPRPVDVTWPWGDVLRIVDAVAPDVRLINLETSVTRADDFAPGKAVHYRMSPDNIACVAAIRPDVCALANNHVLDFGRLGLRDTLDALARAGLRGVGAGPDLARAREPAIAPVPGGRVVVFSFGSTSSGIPRDWAATAGRSGVALLASLSEPSADEIVDEVRAVKQPGDVVIASVHWGSNWGYDVPAAHRHFAHRLIESGVDIVHGHSSHHPRPIEIHRGKLVLYGCGDLVDDYEGISGYEVYRPDLRLLYFASVEAGSGTLIGLRMAVVQARRLRLERAGAADTQWMRSALDQACRPYATRIDISDDGMLTARLGR